VALQPLRQRRPAGALDSFQNSAWVVRSLAWLRDFDPPSRSPAGCSQSLPTSPSPLSRLASSPPTESFSDPVPDRAGAHRERPEAGASQVEPSELLRHHPEGRVRRYASSFADLMEMRAPAEVVEAYLDRHEGWFGRCAAPMEVRPLERNGYVLTLGRFGNFGFEVEPTIGLELLPQAEGVYRILTVSVPDADATLSSLYDVEFNASLRLDEAGAGQGFGDISAEDVDTLMAHTLVRWELDLAVWIKLPAMINILPEGLVQTSGDHLLRQIVRQVSRRLTWKVQEDFHASHGIPCPPRRRARF